MFKYFTCFQILAGVAVVSGLVSNDGMVASRRNFFSSAIATATATAGAVQVAQTRPAFALDMDAFMNQELQKDVKRDLTDDERTCRYAAPSQTTGEACVRAGMKTTRIAGGVDAFGNYDRGDYVKCKTSYPMIDGQYVKTVTCE